MFCHVGGCTNTLPQYLFLCISLDAQDFLLWDGFHGEVHIDLQMIVRNFNYHPISSKKKHAFSNYIISFPPILALLALQTKRKIETEN